MQRVVFAGETDGWRWATGLMLVACACTREPVSVATTSTSTGADPSSSSDVPDTSSGANTSGAPVPTDVGTPCDATLQPGPLTLLTDVDAGQLTSIDMDSDDVTDVIGERGLTVLQNEEVRRLDLLFDQDSVVPGRLAQGQLADLLRLRPDEPIMVLMDVLNPEASAPAVLDASGSPVALGNVDGDLRDEFVVQYGGEIRLWRNPGDDNFVGTEPAAASDVDSIAIISRGAPGRTHVATQGPSGITIFEIGETELVEVEYLETASVYRISAIDHLGTGEYGMMFERYGGPLIDVQSGVGVAHFDNGEWVIREHDLEGAAPYGVAAGDLDDDGDLDLVVGVEGERIDLACLSPSGYALCGRMTIDTSLRSLAVLPDPPRLVISNDDGTWLMPLPSPVCD